MGTCAMTVIHHRLHHPGITAELQHRPADVGQAARARGGRDDPPPHSTTTTTSPLLNKCLLSPSSLTHNQTLTGRCKSHASMSLIIGTHVYTLVYVCLCSHTQTQSHEVCKLTVADVSLLFIVSLPCNNAGSLSAIN